MKASKPYRPKLNRQAQRKAALAFLRCLETNHMTEQMSMGDCISKLVKAGIDLQRSLEPNDKAKLKTALAGIQSAWRTLNYVLPGLSADGLDAMRELADTYKKVTGEDIR